MILCTCSFAPFKFFMSDRVTEIESSASYSLRCKLRVGVSRHMSSLINSNIVIEAKSLYQFMNKCHGILCFLHKHFLFGCLQLEIIGRVWLAPSQKWQNHWGLFCFFPTGWVGFLGFVSLRSTLIHLVDKTFSLGTLTLGLGIDSAGTNLVGVTTVINHSQQTLTLSYHNKINLGIFLLAK